MPHDLSDLYLAPVLLAVDARLEELAKLDVDALANAVAVASDRPDWTREMRAEALLRTIGHLIEDHSWTMALDPRGLRLTHDQHTVVLGTPSSFDAFLGGEGSEALT